MLVRLGTELNRNIAYKKKYGGKKQPLLKRKKKSTRTKRAK